MVGPGGNMDKSVLIVDDDPDMLDVIEEALVFGGYEVKRAQDGRRAWEILEAASTSVILSDYLMPKLNGCELFNLVRASEKNKDTPFIFMSSTPEVICSTGSYSVLRKPFQFDTLILKIKNSMTLCTRSV
jgi:CheY-like chemotaxis protein